MLGRGRICHTEPSRRAGVVMRAAVLVSYFPDGDTLGRTIASLLEQVDRLYWIDNGTSLPLPSLPASEKLTCLRLEHNVGIAAAQNIGIKAATNDGASFVLLSDQDTYFPAKTLENLVDTFQRWPNAAAVVPLFKDTHKKKDDGFILSSTWFFSSRSVSDGEHKLFQAIASGKVLKVDALQKTGLMDESLFIDWVDLEWCWRARKRGFDVIGNAAVTIEHTLGDSAKDLGFREVNLRSPQRHYFITRNAFHLAFRSSSLSSARRFILFLRSLRYLVAFPLLGQQKIENFRAVSQAFYHALLGRMGPRN